ncbi:MAG: hypothetical protein NTW19_14255 [Planctomycetota bacterium]|nr:hypothetical protein [Planctomycetota bacterium]
MATSPTSWNRLAPLRKMLRSLTRAARRGTRLAQRRTSTAPRFSLEPLEARVFLTVTSFDGWTNVTASADSRIIYVSSSTGNDANVGLSAAAPLRTIATALTKVRNGFADWVRLARGDVFNESIAWSASGKNANEPTVLTNYGAGPRPIVQPPSGEDGILIASATPTHDVMILGIDFYARSRDPSVAGFNPSTVSSGIRWISPGANLLVEDCAVRFFNIDVVVSGVGTGAEAMNNFRIRRSVITDAYGVVGHAEGLYVTDVVGITVQENVFDHNGWNAAVVGAEKNVFNHNVYIDNENFSDNNLITGNIITRASSHGIQFRAGGVVTENFLVDDPIGILIGGGDDFPVSSPNGVLAYAYNNVVLASGDIGAMLPRAFGIETLNIRGGIIANNIVAHDKSAFSFGHGVEVSAPTSDLTLANNIVYDWHNPIVIDSGTSVTLQGNYSGAFGAANTPGYVSPNRDAASYNASLGGAATLEAFIAAARNQSRAAWNTAYTAAAANAYVRAGFAVAAADVTAPIAVLEAVNVAVAGGATYTFTVTFSDNTAVRASTLDGSDVRVTGPSNFNVLATFVGASLNSNGTPRTATYSFTAPGGAWDAADNGTYTFTLQAGQVTDVAGNGAVFVTGGKRTIGVSIALPQVASVLVRGSDWSSPFMGAIAAAGHGDNGYVIPAGSGAQLAPLPWNNINQVILRFTKPVNIVASDLVIRGVNTTAYATSSFATGTAADGHFEAIWTLSAPIAGDKMLLILSDRVTDTQGAKLDGEWVNPPSQSTPSGGADIYPSGNGVAGGVFQFYFNVAPGDRNQNGGTNLQDVVLVRNVVGSTTATPGTYSIYGDINGNGGINVQDVVIARNQQGWSLPSGSPTPPSEALALFVQAAAAQPVVDSAPASVEAESTLLQAVAPPMPFASNWTLRPTGLGDSSDDADEDGLAHLLKRRKALRSLVVVAEPAVPPAVPVISEDAARATPADVSGGSVRS